MQNTLDIAKSILLGPGNLSDQAVERVLGSILNYQIDYADLYFQSILHESWSLEDCKVKDGSFNVDRGVGVRANSGEKTGFAYSDDIILPALENAAKAARAIAKQGEHNGKQIWHRQGQVALYAPVNPLDSLPKEDKILLLQRLDKAARALDPRIVHVNVSLSGVYETVLIMASDGTLAADIRPLVRLNISVLAEEKGRRESGNCGGGARSDYSYFFEEDRAMEYVNEAVRQALINLKAAPAPAGSMPVILGPGWPGVLLHEAVGHGLEGDFNRKGSSAFSGKLGEQVASLHCTVVDDGTLPGRRGSLTVDDEGVPSQKTILIENGILKNYMQDKLNARLMGMQPTGNGRRESYAHIPMPRMTNTYMLPGQHAPEDIIRSVDKGIYAVNFSGGQVDITSGKFVFSASEAYLIENGKVTKPIKGATLIGDGANVMKQISMVGNDLKLDKGVGVCGKDGQSVPVGVGQPTLKIDEITVGGTQVL